MMSGTAIAQAIPIAIAPLLSRIFSPAEFGVLGTLLAISAILGVFCTARYDLAIVLSSNDTAAKAIAGATTFLALAVGLLSLIVLVTAGDTLLGLFGLGAIAEWAWTIPVIASLGAIGQIGNNFANRDRDYGRIAKANVWQQVITAAVSVAAGLMKVPAGLILGRIIGSGAYFVRFIPVFRTVFGGFNREWSWQDAGREMARYRQFPQFNLPYSVVGSFSREFIVIALSSFRDVAAAGYYTLARAVLTAPVSFLSSSLSQVFYREAAEHAGTPEFVQLTERMLTGMALVMTPVIAWVFCWAPSLFRWIFGAQWEAAGWYAVALSIPALLSIFTSWPERIFEVTNRQNWAFVIQIIFDAIGIVIVWSMLANGADTLTTIQVFAAVLCVYHLVYLRIVFKLVGMGSKRYGALLVKILVLVLLVWVAAQLGIFFYQNEWVTPIATGALALFMSIGGAWYMKSAYLPRVAPPSGKKS